MLVIVRGRASVRTPAGWSVLEKGAVMAFPVGEAGAHQVVGASDEPAHVLLVSQMTTPELTLYPDSGKLGAFDELGRAAGEGFRALFRLDSAVDYYDGEQPPAVPE